MTVVRTFEFENDFLELWNPSSASVRRRDQFGTVLCLPDRLSQRAEDRRHYQLTKADYWKRQTKYIFCLIYRGNWTVFFKTILQYFHTSHEVYPVSPNRNMFTFVRQGLSITSTNGQMPTYIKGVPWEGESTQAKIAISIINRSHLGIPAMQAKEASLRDARRGSDISEPPVKT